MPPPQSPHYSRSEDIAGSVGSDPASITVSCTPLPDHIQDTPAPATASSSAETSRMTTAVDEQFHPREQQPLPTTAILEEAEEMHWPTQSDFSADPTRQGGMGFSSAPLTPNSGDHYFCSNDATFYNDGFDLTSTNYTSPRSYNTIDFSSMPRNMNSAEAYPPSAYYLEPPKYPDTAIVSSYGSDDSFMQMDEDYEHQYGLQSRPSAHNAYLSPYSDMTRSSTPHDVQSPYSHEFDVLEDAAIDKDQPYAQLIYQALLQADDHTMILRDIYEWFKKNTDKATMSETKGWQNSIRHNLSMNGAFEKVDQPCEDSRKGYMWRLTEEALHEGVKSTTRYRSKQPNKRSHRLQQPQPQRQASGAKGGQASRRSAANLKRNKRMNNQFRSEPYDPRQAPNTFPQNYNTTIPYPPSPYYTSDTPYDQPLKQDQKPLTFQIKQEHSPYDIPIPQDHHHQHQHHTFPTSPPPPTAETHEFFSSTSTTPYTGTTMPYVKAFNNESIYAMSQSPSEPSYTNSSSPSASEPRTPLLQNGSGNGNGGWSEDGDASMGMGMPCIFEDMAFPEFMG